MKCSAVVNFLMLLKSIPVSKTITGKPKIALLNAVNILQFIAFCVCYGVYTYTICQVRYWVYYIVVSISTLLLPQFQL